MMTFLVIYVSLLTGVASSGVVAIVVESDENLINHLTRSIEWDDFGSSEKHSNWSQLIKSNEWWENFTIFNFDDLSIADICARSN